MANLNERIRDFRQNLGQSIEALALLMQMDPQEYARLEVDWIPPDDLLERLCALFEWNFQEILQLARRTPVSIPHASFHGSDALQELPKAAEGQTVFSAMLRQAREQAGQPAEGVAMLLGLPTEHYLELEQGHSVSDELLQRLCSLFHWNYVQTRQRLRNQNALVFSGPQRPLNVEEIRDSIPHIEFPNPPEMVEDQDPRLGERLRVAREVVGQTVEGVALLLEVNDEYYLEMEAGTIHPDDELLKRIAVIFRWNYNELKAKEHKQRFGSIQPSVTQLPESGFSGNRHKLKNLFDAVNKGWNHLSRTQQDSLLAQLELIKESVVRWSQTKTSVPQANVHPSLSEEARSALPAAVRSSSPSVPAPAFKNLVRKPSPSESS